ncbi:sigma-70 family RNA polymerase sigma factor [Streptomyces sp. NBC_00237]|uniref:sigma-70 family RNA polymerase sigma factor n=1 Tax=Streptomyces sp. NBC_00237 TaxID=2975687 RepID=UPI0022585241|nr:sigma-70 family RNA polymerase sigma factor [Streptomyces sp. NBC_00237]MCX5206157.1 sigma-70 family RNA polymerase sigma factor [Streptomyces sp. NBC_00237]
MTDVHRTVDAIWKMESARIVAALTRMVRDVGVAEELAQDALVAALERWPESGIPDNPGAWLTTVAKRRAVDHIRRDRRSAEHGETLAHELAERQRLDGDGDGGVDHDLESAGSAGSADPTEPASEQDDVLRLMFVSCHSVLPTQARVALTLRLLGGLTASEIARAFLTAEPLIARRIATAKRTLAEERVPFEIPDGAELTERLASVLEVVYLIFNEGYSATSGDDLMRPGLCLEALRLGRLLARSVPDEAEVHGLVALMEVQASRTAARTGPAGEPVPLHLQNRGRWDPLLIRRGFAAMLRARAAGTPGQPGPYVLQAAIAVCHAQARTAEETDWARICGLYAALARLLPTAVVRLNQAVAVGMADGPAAGLALVDTLTSDPSLRDYHLLPGVRGDLLLRLGRGEEARREFERAALLTRNAAERAYLTRRAEAIPAGDTSTPTFGEAIDAFLAQDRLAPATARSYGQTLWRLRLALGVGMPLTSLTADQVSGAFRLSWGGVAASTWNRHRAAVRAFGAWAHTPALDAAIPQRTPRRHRAPAPVPAPVPPGTAWPGEVEASLRERTLWTLLHESGSTVTALLALNVQDLDLPERRARRADRRPDRPGGWITWRSKTAALLSELLDGRTQGPVFLTDRRPGPARTGILGAADVCPQTGRGRLSYERAEFLCKSATGLALRQLRDWDGDQGGDGTEP